MTTTGHGAQVVLDGAAQAAARGAYTNTLPGNTAAMAQMFNAGTVSDGSTADGSTLTGVAPYDQPRAVYRMPAVVGDGVADDTAALQAAINAAAEGETVFLPPGLFKITAPLSITKNMTLMGSGVYTVWDTLTNAPQAINTPSKSPFLYGSVILQTTAAANAINITGTGKAVNLRHFGIRFADAIRHINTGHGVYAVPTDIYQTFHDHGIMFATWEDVVVFGHDGNHYAYYMMNPIYCRFDHLAGFGGGFLHFECDSAAWEYGNLTWSDTYGGLYCPGTAHGIELVARQGTGPGGADLIVFIRPQINMMPEPISYPETNPGPTYASQKAFDGGTIAILTIIQPDFEPVNVAGKALVTLNTGARFLTNESNVGAIDQTQWSSQAPHFRGKRVMGSNNLIVGYGAAVTAAAGAQAGTSPPAPVVGSTVSGEFAGQVTFGTGASATAGILVGIVWPGNKGVLYTVVVTAANAATAALGVPYAIKATNGFTVGFPGTPASSQANTVYAVDYQVRFDG